MLNGGCYHVRIDECRFFCRFCVQGKSLHFNSVVGGGLCRMEGRRVGERVDFCLSDVSVCMVGGGGLFWVGGCLVSFSDGKGICFNIVWGVFINEIRKLTLLTSKK